MSGTSQEYMIQVGTNLNTQKAQDQLKDFVKKSEKSSIVEIKVKGLDGKGNSITKLQKQLQTLTTYADANGNSFNALSKNVIRADGSLINVSNTITKANTNFDLYNKSINETSTTTKTYLNSNAQLVTEMTQVNQYGQKINTTITKTTDELGGITTQTKVYNETLGETISLDKQYNLDLVKREQELRKVAQEEAKLAQAEKEKMANTSTTITQTKERVNGYKALVTTTQEVNAKGETLVTVTKEYTNSAGYAVKQTQQLDANGKAVSGTVTTMTKNLKNASNSAKGLGQSFTDVIGKVAKFYLATLPIQMIQRTITEAVNVVSEFDSAFTELSKVVSLSGDELTAYTEKLGEIGTEVARTRTEMVQTATELTKAGYDTTEVETLSKLVALYQNTADEELSASDATSVLVSQMKAFNVEVEDAIHITDAINQVSQDFAVSSGDIGRGLTQAGASLSTYGNTFDQTIGLVTAGTEIFQGKSQQVARGLNTVASRIAKNEDALQSYGIQTRNTNNDLLSTYDILTQLAFGGDNVTKTWGEMSNAEKVALGTTLAGVNQYKVFSAVMNNFQTAVDATNESLNSAGATERQNAVYMESLKAKVTALKAEFEKLILGDGGLGNMAKSLVDIATKTLAMANKLGGLSNILKTLGGIIISLKMDTIVSKINNITKIIPNLITMIKTLSISLTGVVGIVAGVVTAFASITTAIKNYKTEKEEQAYSNAMSVKSEIDSIQSLKNKLEDENITREELNSIVNSNLQAYKDEIDSINDVNDAREVALEKLREYNSEQSRTKAEEMLPDYQSALKSLSTDYSKELRGAWTGLSTDNIKSLGFDLNYMSNASSLEEYISKLHELQDALATSPYAGTNNFSTALSQVNDAIKEAETRFDTLTGTMQVFETVASQAGLKYDENTGALVQMSEAELQLANSVDFVNGTINAQGNAIDGQVSAIERLAEASADETNSLYGQADALDELAEQYDISDENLEAIAERMLETGDSASECAEELGITANALGDASEEADKASQAFKNAVSAVGELDDAYGVLSSAVSEYNSSGGFTLDSLEKLLNLSPEYLSCLQLENGQLSLNEASFYNLANSMIDSAEAQALANTQAQLAAGAFNTLSSATSGAGSTASSSSGGNYTLSNSLDNVTVSANNATTAISRYLATLKGSSAYTNANSTAQTNAVKSLTAQITALESVRKNIGSYTKAVSGSSSGKSGGGGGSTGATKKNTEAVEDNTEALKNQAEALKEVKEALDDEVDSYKKVISYIKKKIDELTESIEEERDTALDSIDAQIDALEELKDKELDDIDKQLDALKEARDAEEDYWDAKIEALKAQNEALEDQLEYEKLLQDLETAKSSKVKVYREGKGFVYETDQTAVDKAQEAIDEYNRKKQYETELAELKRFKDESKKNYDQQIQDLEDYKDQREEEYDAQIEDLKKYREMVKNEYNTQIDYYKSWLKDFEKQTDAYETEQNRLLAIQLTGIDFEKQNWQTRLQNLDSFCASYIEKQKSLETATAQYEEAQKAYEQAKANASASATGGSYSGGGGGGGYDLGGGYGDYEEPEDYTVFEILYSDKSSSNAGQALSEKKKKATEADKKKMGVASYGGYYVVYKKLDGLYTKTDASNTASSLVSSSNGKKKYGYLQFASGVSSISDDQLAIVGEDPNKEIVLGSKLNNGTAMKLGKGSGVVNAKSTNTLAGILNQLGAFSSSNFGQGSQQYNNTTSNENFVVESVTINGANITDVNSFKNSLMSLKSEATQRAYRHK